MFQLAKISPGCSRKFYDNKIKHHFFLNYSVGTQPLTIILSFLLYKKLRVGPEVFVLALHVWCFLWTHEIFGTLGVVGLPKTNGQLQNAERNEGSSMKGINLKRKQILTVLLHNGGSWNACTMKRCITLLCIPKHNGVVPYLLIILNSYFNHFG